MSTSLAEQLQRLAVPQISALKRDKKRPSLIFDAKEAAGLKRETVFYIGSEGLEELIIKNEAFEIFRNTLFHITSKNFERSTVVAEDNEKLNKNIRKFLFLLSPYFLMDCTRKALEWLVCRYSIHEYNRNDLLMLALPYHESNFFVRIIQTMKFEETENYSFLKPLQKTGVHLPKQSLLNHAASNCAFLKHVGKYILQLINQHSNPNVLTVAFNFYCSVFLGSIEYTQKINEDQVSMMLPSLLKGLNSSITDFCAAAYVITARLVTRAAISNKLLEKFVEKISEVKVEGLKTEATLLLVVLYQSQNQCPDISPAAVANLAEKQWLPSVLQTLSKSGAFIVPFLRRLLCRGIHEGAHNDLKLVKEMVQNCLNKIKLDEEFVLTVINSLLDAMYPKANLTHTVQYWLSEILQTMERQYPTYFDKEVCRILSQTSLSDEHAKKKKRCLSKILSNTEHYRGKVDILQKLYHANPEIRGQAVKYLKNNYSKLRDSEKEFVRTSFVDRLNDDHVNVVADTIVVILKSEVIDVKSLKNVWIDLAAKCRRDPDKWKKIKKKVTAVCCNFQDDCEMFVTMLPFLLPLTDKELLLAKGLVKYTLFSDNDVLKPFVKQLEEASDIVTFEKLILESLQLNKCEDMVKKLLKVAGTLPDDNGHKYVAFLISASMLPEESSLELGASLVEMLYQHWNNSSTHKRNFEVANNFGTYIKLAEQGKLPATSYIRCLENLIQKLKIPDWEVHLKDFNENMPQNEFFVLSTELLLKYSFKPLLKLFLDRFFNGCVDTQFVYFLNLCICGNESLSKNIVTNCLKFIKVQINNIPEEEDLLALDKLTVPFLMATLLSPSEADRRTVFEIIELLISKYKEKASPYYTFLEYLIKQKEEITVDQEQTPLIFFNIFNSKLKKHAADLKSCKERFLEIACDEQFPSYLVSNILKIFSMVNNLEILERLAPVGLKLLKKFGQSLHSYIANILVHIVNRIEADILKNLDSKSNSWKLIETCIKADNVMVWQQDNDKVCLSTIALNQLDKEVFKVLNPEDCKRLLDVIIELATVAHHPEVPPTVSRIFKHLDLDASHILDQLVAMRDVQSSKTSEVAKRRRTSVIPTVDILDTIQWKKGVTVLEYIQDKKKIRSFEALLPVLFDLLKRCLDFDEQAAVEYPKQLLLAAILNCCQRSGNELPESVFNVELVVQCIRASQNPQTHHFALLLLAHTAHFAPKQVLLHMITIFTFMGSSVLRHDDSYSFQVISKIIETVVPILTKDNNPERLGSVLRVFVDAMLDVPEHRRRPLYKQLLEKIDEKENLHIFLLVVFESQVLRSAQEKKSDLAQKRLDMAADLCRQFPPKTVIGVCIKLLKYLKDLPDEKDENAMQVDNTEGHFSVTTRTPKDFRHFKYILLKFTTNLLSSQEFVTQVATLSKDEELELEDLFKEIIINILQYIQRISKITDRSANTPQAHYWKVVLHLSYDILDSVNALVTSQMFLLVTKGLMVHNLNTVRRRVFELLNTKLQYNLQFFEDCDQSEIYSIMPPLISIVESLNEEIDQEQETIVQTALLSLKLLVKALAVKEPEKFVPILEFITDILQSGKAQNNVLASVLLCLAELCVNLRAHAISALPNFMPTVTKILKKCKREETPSVLLRSAITTVERIFDSVPLFLSPYLEKLLTEICQLAAKWDEGGEEQKVQSFVSKIVIMKKKIGSVIPARVLLPALEDCYEKLAANKSYKGIGALMDILGENLAYLQSAELSSTLPELTSFFLNVLKFRDEIEVSRVDANEVESHVVRALSALILKLSESSFRPFYYKLYDWAVRGNIRSERAITFYK
ncbi:unnamed protein product [Acanthoscelides obtectus]|nr:unnamed protein product [Acanthoscelides obtectus]CAK1662947.1 HEAT repeat-containing protein 1 [Acanthoscelides obtectus]